MKVSTRAVMVAVSFLALFALLFLQPSAPAGAAPFRFAEEMTAGPLPSHGVPVAVTVVSRDGSPIECTLKLYEDGQVVRQRTVQIARNGSFTLTDLETADGFIVDCNDVHFVMLRWSQFPSGAGLGGAFPVFQTFGFGPLLTPFLNPPFDGQRGETVYRLMNVGADQARADTYTNVGGDRSHQFDGRDLEGRRVVTITRRQLPDLRRRVSVATTETYTDTPPVHSGSSKTTPRDGEAFTVPGKPGGIFSNSPLGSRRASEEFYVPPTGRSPSNSVCYSLNTGFASQVVTMQTLDDDGDPLASRTRTVPGSGITHQDNGGRPLVVTGDGSAPLYTLCVEQYGAGESGRLAGGTSTVRFGSPAATRRAKVFGAPAFRKSRVSIGLFNAGDSRLKAKVIVYKSDGRKAFARTMRVQPGQTGFLKYKRKAFGLGSWVDVKIRGQGAGVPFLLQEARDTGDLTYYPPVILR